MFKASQLKEQALQREIERSIPGFGPMDGPIGGPWLAWKLDGDAFSGMSDLLDVVWNKSHFGRKSTENDSLDTAEHIIERACETFCSLSHWQPRWFHLGESLTYVPRNASSKRVRVCSLAGMEGSQPCFVPLPGCELKSLTTMSREEIVTENRQYQEACKEAGEGRAEVPLSIVPSDLFPFAVVWLGAEGEGGGCIFLATDTTARRDEWHAAFEESVAENSRAWREFNE